MPAYPQSNAVGVSPSAATTLQAVANATGLTKSEIVSRLIETHLTPAVELGAGLIGFMSPTRNRGVSA